MGLSTLPPGGRRAALVRHSLKSMERIKHTIQPLFENLTRGAKVETHMPFAILSINTSITECHFRFLHKETIGGWFKTQLGEIQPGEIGCVWHGDLHSGHVLGHIVNQKIAVASEIVTQFF